MMDTQKDFFVCVKDLAITSVHLVTLFIAEIDFL